MGTVYTSPVKNYIQRNGFVMVSNLLMDYQGCLGITDSELVFLIKIMKSKSPIVHDRDLDATVCAKTLSRRRNSLKEKGLIRFSTIKRQDPDTGTFSTDGISYDLSPLEAKLQEISDSLELKKKEEIEKVIEQNNLIVEATDDNEGNSPIEKLANGFKKNYKENYIPNHTEVSFYNSLTEEEQSIFAHAFEWLVESNNLGKLKPRIALFMKASFRFDELKEFCREKGYLRTFEEAEEIARQQREEFSEKEAIKVHAKYYKEVSDNKCFYLLLKRSLYMHYDEVKDGNYSEFMIRNLDNLYNQSKNERGLK